MPPGEYALASRLGEAPRPTDPKRVKVHLDDLIGRAKEEGAKELVRLLADGPVRDLCMALTAHSPFLWQLALLDPARLERLLTQDPQHSHAEIVSAQARLFEGLRDGSMGRAEIMRRMRVNRAAHALLVALCDIGGVWSLEEVTQALSGFADASVRGAVRVVLTEAAGLGRLTLPDPSDPEAGCGFVVLALGKHGAEELNYSSDIDLVVFFDPETRILRDVTEATPVYSRLAQQIARLLQERTSDGYVHRVDYRLRPDPGSTPTAVSLASAYTYYETLGQNWERAALIKARPVAGELALGEHFLADLRPFIWRKYFDFASIADVHAMKRQIHAVRGHDEIAVAGHDIKLGRGGIREIEFFVQTQQLVFGGRRPALRGRRTLDMLPALHDEGWITQEARDDLTRAYRFLRTIEHRLQMVADEQTQRLPSDPAALKNFAHFSGFPNLNAFEKELTTEASNVQRHYAMLFEEGPELAADAGSLVFTGTSDDPETLSTLARLGFKHPEAVAETVRGWHFGRRTAITSARAREVLTELVPPLLVALGGTADPDGALASLDQAFGRMPAAVELLTILQSHDRLRLLFADLLGTAPRLADTVAQAPHVLDGLIDPAFVQPAIESEVIARQVHELIGTPSGFEDFLDRIRDANRYIRFINSARLLSDIITPAQAGEAYAAIAEATIDETLRQVRAAFEIDHGTVPASRLAILGLGRLGSRELTAGSDLDLVVIYDFDPEVRNSTGPRSLDVVVYYTRLTQRLIGALTVPTRRGRLYDVDLRLRPQGGKGPVAVQFSGFVSYQREEAELWEHMALTRARVLFADEGFAQPVESAVREVVGRERRIEEVRGQARAMRDLISAEKGEGNGWDLKLAPGGLTDLDFLAQFLVLSHANRIPALIGLDTETVFVRAGQEGLIGSDDASRLRSAHRLLDDVFQWQRLTVEGPFDPDTVSPTIFKRLASVVGLPGTEQLRSQLEETRRDVRKIFERLLPA